MRGLDEFPAVKFAAVSVLLLGMSCSAAFAKPLASPAEERDTVVVVYKDGHKQSLAMAEISRIDFKTPASIVYKDGHREKLSRCAIFTPRASRCGMWEARDFLRACPREKARWCFPWAGQS